MAVTRYGRDGRKRKGPTRGHNTQPQPSTTAERIPLLTQNSKPAKCGNTYSPSPLTLVTTLDLFCVPSDAVFVNFLDLSAKQMTGGAIAAVNGQLNLLEKRKKIHIADRGGINQSITMAGRRLGPESSG